MLRLGETDRQGDQDATLGAAVLTGSSGQGIINDRQGGHWKLTLHNPNFGGTFDANAISISIAPIGGLPPR